MYAHVLCVTIHGLLGTQWHLHKTNWCGEATDVLEDEVR